MFRALGSLAKQSYDREYEDKTLLKRLFPYLLNHKLYLSLSFVFAILTALVSLLNPLLFSIAFDEVIKENPSIDLIISATLGYVILLALEWYFDYKFSVNRQKLQVNATYDLRMNLFKRINRHELTFFDHHKTGEIMSRVSGDAYQVGSVLATFVDLGSIGFLALFLIGTMLVLNWQLTLISLAVFPVLIGIIFLFRRVIREFTHTLRRAESNVNSAVEEFVKGIQITKTFGREAAVLDQFRKLENQKVKAKIKRMALFRSFSPILDFFTAVALFIILIGGGFAVDSTVFTPGLLYLFISYLRRLFEPMVRLSTFYANLQGGLAAAERIFSLMDVPVEIKKGKLDCPELRGRIEFKDVDFWYEEDQPVLRDFNLIIPEGETLAIVGETGAGKTTIASLLARFYEYQSGQILIDGKNIQELNPDSLRDQLGYVLQEPFLFSGSIRDNILLGSPDAQEQQVQWALKSVKADKFISLLPKGLKTQVKERGKNLSQGQRQLLSLARILLKNPKVLILDEATASVDAYTEKMIQDALKLVFENRTTIVIAHRLSTVLDADRIIVIRDGRIIEEGNHEELIKEEGEYRKLYQTYYAHQGALEELEVIKTDNM